MICEEIFRLSKSSLQSARPHTTQETRSEFLYILACLAIRVTAAPQDVDHLRPAADPLCSGCLPTLQRMRSNGQAFKHFVTL